MISPLYTGNTNPTSRGFLLSPQMYSTVATCRSSWETEPVSYTLLQLPPKREMRKKGFGVTEINTTATRDHPLAKWSKYALKKGATYRDALDAIEEANKKSWGLLKARIFFSCGSFDSYERLNPGDPLTLKHTGMYDPNGVYKDATIAESTYSRERLLPRLRPLVDERGHHTCSKKLPRTFAPSVMYKNCPPPVLTQAGYDFTPISHTSFLLRAGDHPPGVRDVKSDFTKNSSDYRPRSYLRDKVWGGVNSRHCHCAEVFQVGDYTMDLARITDTVNHRNHTNVKEFTKTGTLKSNSIIVGRRHAKRNRFPFSHHTNGAANTLPAEEKGFDHVMESPAKDAAALVPHQPEEPTAHFNESSPAMA